METNPTTEERKNLTWEGFQTMAADLIVRLKAEIQAAILEPIQQAQAIADSFTIRNVGTQDNVEGIVNAFARDPETGETEHTRLVTQQWPGDPVSSQPVDTNVQQISCADGESYNFVDEQSSPSVEGFPFRWVRHVSGSIYMYVYTANRNPSVGDTAKYNAAIDPTTVTVADRPSVGTQHTVYDSIMYIGGEEVTV